MRAERIYGGRAGAYAGTIALVALATGIGVIAFGPLSSADVVMLYLLGTVVAAVRFGRGPSILAAILTVIAYNFFFVPPVHTFRVADPHHLLTFATLLVVGLLISELTLRNRRVTLDRFRFAEAARAAEMRARNEEMRSSLLSAVSHDLRSPLGAITGAATTLRDSAGALDEGQRRELIGTICDEAKRLERFVGNLLDMTRLESGAIEVRREWVPLEEIIGSALDRLEEQLEGRPVRVTLPPEPPLVSVDPVMFEQLVYNLVDNATKHTPEGSAITVSAGTRNGQLLLEVADSGPGLPSGSEGRLFEKFVRGPHPAVGGAGLGLAICRAIAAAHGGRISAHNRSEGGATFEVVVPLVGDAPRVPAEVLAGPEARG